MRGVILTYCCFCLINSLSAQKHDNIWHFGSSTISSAMVIDFNYPNDSIYFINRPIEPGQDNASICDADGNSLFMTNGLSIADSSNQIMQNGTGLNPGLFAQWYPSGYPIGDGAIVLPNPGGDSLYSLFHLGIDTGGAQGLQVQQLYVTTINMNLNGGKGVVIEKNRLLLSDTLFYGHLEAIKHGNGEDWWVLIPELHTNGYYRFLLTSDSIYGPYYQQIGQAYDLDATSQAAVSPDGEKYARYSVYFDLDIFDFDRCTGLLSNYLHIPIQDSADIGGGAGGGVAFSPSSQYLYVSSIWKVYQYDMEASNIVLSKDTVAIYDGFIPPPSSILKTTFFMAQLAPNGKIYVNCTFGSDHIHVIHYPDSAGQACHFEQHGVKFPSGTGITMPNFAHYRTPALSTPCDTMTTVAIVEEELDVVRLYPNPASQEVTLEWISEETGDLNRKIMIYNALGQIVYSSIIQNTTSAINTSTWTAGLYLCQLYENGVFVESKKLIIVKP